MGNYKQLLKNISTFIFDVDGVFTDGSVLLMPDGEQLRTMHVKDGYALQLAIKKGYRIAIISGGKGDSVYQRFSYLGVTDIYLGVNNKLEVFHNYMKKNGLEPESVLFMGDDIPDYEIMLEVGVPTCPANAAEEIKKISKYISDIKGGKGCVRDVIEQVLKIQEKWFDHEAFHW